MTWEYCHFCHLLLFSLCQATSLPFFGLATGKNVRAGPLLKVWWQMCIAHLHLLAHLNLNDKKHHGGLDLRHFPNVGLAPERSNWPNDRWNLHLTCTKQLMPCYLKVQTAKSSSFSSILVATRKTCLLKKKKKNPLWNSKTDFSVSATGISRLRRLLICRNFWHREILIPSSQQHLIHSPDIAPRHVDPRVTGNSYFAYPSPVKHPQVEQLTRL